MPGMDSAGAEGAGFYSAHYSQIPLLAAAALTQQSAQPFYTKVRLGPALKLAPSAQCIAGGNFCNKAWFYQN